MKKFTKFSALLLCFLLIEKINAATITAAATGSWTATSTWTGGVVPTTNDNVIIPAGRTVTYSQTTTGNFINPATISVSGTIVFESTLGAKFVFENAITITVESGGVFRDNTKEGGYSFNSRVSSFVFRTGSSVTIGTNNTFGDTYVVANSSLSYTAGTVFSPSTPRPFTVSGNGTTVVLPLTLLSFVAYPQNALVNLSWQTTNEINVSHIYVERSVDGSSFTRINKRNAIGGGNYSYSDDVSALNSGKLYYRLLVVDKDGSSSVSKVINVQLGSVARRLSLYPNPVINNLFVQFSSTQRERISIEVADLQGKILQQQYTDVSVGNVALSINTSTLAKGSYVLLIKGSATIQQKQFVKE